MAIQNDPSITIPDANGAKSALKSLLANHGDYEHFKQTIPDPVSGQLGGRRLQSKADIIAAADFLNVDIQQFLTDYENGTDATTQSQSSQSGSPSPNTELTTVKQASYIAILRRKLAKKYPAYPDRFNALLLADKANHPAGDYVQPDTVRDWLDQDIRTKAMASRAIGAFRVALELDQPGSNPVGDFDDISDMDQDCQSDKSADQDCQSDKSADQDSQAVELVNQQFAKFAAGDMEGFRAGIIELAKQALEPKQVTAKQVTAKQVTISQRYDANGNLIVPDIDPQPTAIKTARELWPDLPKDAESYGFQCYDYVEPIPMAVDYDMSILHASESLRLVAAAVQRGKHVWLAGEKGTGKTTFTRALAQATGRPFFRVQHFASMEPLDLVGGFQIVNGETVWKDGLLIQAVRTPHAVILLDEPTLSAMACQLYQTVLDEGYVYIAVTGERVPVAPGVTFCVADNSLGNGDDTGLYDGIAATNAAGNDRYAYKLEMQYLTPKAEAALLVASTGIKAESARAIADYAFKIRKACADKDVSEPISYRRLEALADAIVAGVSTQRALEAAVFTYPRHPEDQEAYRAIASAHLPDSL